MIALFTEAYKNEWSVVLVKDRHQAITQINGNSNELYFTDG